MWPLACDRRLAATQVLIHDVSLGDDCQLLVYWLFFVWNA